MGFFEDAGNWLGDITGFNQSKSANQLKGQGAGNMQSGATAAGGIANKGAGQFAQEAGQAGSALGEQMGRQAATAGSQAATQAARTAGVNKGQAALLGGQEAGRAFTQGQQAGQGLGMGAYGQGAGIQLGGAGTQGQIGYNQTGGGQASQNAGTSAAGGLLGAFSDENKKDDIKTALNLGNILGGLGGGAAGGASAAAPLMALSDKDAKEGVKPDLEQVSDKVRPVEFEYKPEMGQGTGEHIGITAQDMEKTPLKENVIDTPMGKMIHPGKQENSNLNMIVQLSRKVDELLKQRSKVNA